MTRAETGSARRQGTGAVVVLDPAGLAGHGRGELPATWRGLAQRREVVWCRLPDGEAMTAVQDALGKLPDGDRADLLASGEAADAALSAAERWSDRIGRVLLVDPGAGAGVAPGEPARQAADRWMSEHESQCDALSRSGVDVRLVAYSVGGGRDRVAPPMPLGHPDVVAAVERESS